MRTTSRVSAFALVAIVIVTSAVGPAHLAAAVGLTSGPPAPTAAVGFLPEPTPVEVKAPTLRLTGLSALATTGQSIELSDGTMSPTSSTLTDTTIRLDFTTINLDNLVINQSIAGGFHFTITNPGSNQASAQIGGAGQQVQLWGVVRSLNLCLSASTLTSLVAGYASALGGLLSTVLGLIAQLGNAGPCPSLVDGSAPLLQLIALLVNNHVPLPPTIPAADLDILVYAMHVTAGADQHSLLLPTGNVVVQP